MNKSDLDYDFICIIFPIILILIKNSRLPINCQMPLILIINLWSMFENTLPLKSILYWSFGI